MYKNTTKLILFLSILLSNLLVSKSTVANDECSSLNMYEVVNSLSDSIVREDWVFPFAIGIDASIENCQYFASDEAYLIRALVNWNGPMEGLFYESRIKYILSPDGSWEFELLDANGNLKNHFVSNALPFKVIESFGESEAESYNIVCINNGLDADITVSFKWGDAEAWKTYTVESKGSAWFSNKVDEPFYVKYSPQYWAEDTRTENKYATLESNVSEIQHCDVPETYTFWIDEELQDIGLFKDYK